MQKIKELLESEKGKDILIVIIVILVGIGSFELGRLSKESTEEGIKILSAQAGQYTGKNGPEPANVISAVALDPGTGTSSGLPAQTGKNFFASNRGTKYYSLGCSGGKTIKQENRVYFATGEEAEAAGYELSTSCR